ncbi:MAG: class I SAM-dependent methyltransferase [Bryobacterales bacterium]|nr:class I SAM-dependent methyltransferase [Bryobacterales bacterium]
MLDGLKDWIDRFRSGGEDEGRSPQRHRRTAQRPPTSTIRSSSALREFFESIRDQLGLNILDFSGAGQQNVTFLTGLGHRLFAESFPHAVEAVFGTDPSPADMRSPEKISSLLQYSLNFEAQSVDAILLWDGLEWLEPDAQRAVVGRILEVLRPNGVLFAVFHAENAAPEVPVHYFKLLDPETLSVADTGSDRPHRLFTNRSVEKLFERCQSVKFFLSRDNLREVIVRR